MNFELYEGFWTNGKKNGFFRVKKSTEFTEFVCECEFKNDQENGLYAEYHDDGSV